MEITKEDAQLILGALDRVEVRGLETNRQVMVLAAKLSAFLQPAQPPVEPTEEDNGDDVPDSSE